MTLKSKSIVEDKYLNLKGNSKNDDCINNYKLHLKNQYTTKSWKMIALKKQMVSVLVGNKLQSKNFQSSNNRVEVHVMT